MYSGDNPSALRSREQIVNAMLILLNKIPYNQINISTLAKQAKISRQTFYKIFDSQEQVLQFKLDSIYQVYYSKLKQKKEYTTNIEVYLYFKMYAENASFFNALIDNDLFTILLQSSLKYIKMLQQTHQLADRQHTVYSYSFIAGGLLQLLTTWHQQEEKQRMSFKELVKISERLVESNYSIHI